jgi:phosphoribosylanthranilate isomerase
MTNLEDARAAVAVGADAVGFVFAPESPRYITPDAARQIVSALPSFVETVGVFTTGEAGDIRHVIDLCGVDRIQFHGTFPDEVVQPFSNRAIHVIRVRDESSLLSIPPYPVRALLLDCYHDQVLGGTGQAFDWNIAVTAGRLMPIILAGGLTAANVQTAIRQVRPYGVDVSSGVEMAKGRKDREKMAAFIQAVREAI